ncbi:NUDIX hydrolase [Massilia genomosp. 1]|uniref:NUDIX hydrolase n=1 Tax=Massilia genomosp. 1 TaxID=2609280 RepID=A0ABX0N435_9BURK|nr:NUDIX hydrolase [Massilia genomosp. 1]NHZ64869.1 NUDIX hydrolase [Massilia genomosp. 1]
MPENLIPPPQHYPNDVICTVDTVLLTLADDGLCVALLKREREPYKGVAALPGGYIHADKDIDGYGAALRVLKTKTGIDVPYLEQLAAFTGAARDPRGWSVSLTYYALVPHAVITAAGHPGVKLVGVDRLHTLPFDHGVIVAAAVERLRSKSQYSSLPCFLVGELFTLPQLQRVYEALMGEALNKVSFRRKMAELDVLEAAEGQMDTSSPSRPAQLYRLRPEFRDRLGLLKRGL